jgi:hypothetical protein
MKKKTNKIINFFAILFNFGFLIFTVGLVIIEEVSFSDMRIIDFAGFLLVFGAPILTLFALCSQTEEKSWIKLFFERKALEERQKIKRLKE